MIGRAAMENPWIFGDAKYYLLHGAMPPARDPQEKAALILGMPGWPWSPAIMGMNFTRCAI